MSGRSAVNTGNTIAIIMLELKRHFNVCETCRGAICVHDYELICGWARMKLISVAKLWDSNIALRLKARKSGERFIYRCPDLNKHGPAYALTAEPLMVTGTQERLM